MDLALLSWDGEFFFLDTDGPQMGADDLRDAIGRGSEGERIGIVWRFGFEVDVCDWAVLMFDTLFGRGGEPFEDGHEISPYIGRLDSKNLALPTCEKSVKHREWDGSVSGPVRGRA